VRSIVSAEYGVLAGGLGVDGTNPDIAAVGIVVPSIFNVPPLVDPKSMVPAKAAARPSNSSVDGPTMLNVPEPVTGPFIVNVPPGPPSAVTVPESSTDPLMVPAPDKVDPALRVSLEPEAIAMLPATLIAPPEVTETAPATPTTNPPAASTLPRWLTVSDPLPLFPTTIPEEALQVEPAPSTLTVPVAPELFPMTSSSWPRVTTLPPLSMVRVPEPPPVAGP
jgi:hypothetical protein